MGQVRLYVHLHVALPPFQMQNTCLKFHKGTVDFFFWMHIIDGSLCRRLRLFLSSITLLLNTSQDVNMLKMDIFLNWSWKNSK